MAKFGNGYGSECHLLRYLGRHRERLNERVNELLSSDDLRWLDDTWAAHWPNPKAPEKWPDAEWKSLDFLPRDSAVVEEWRDRWPHGGNTMNWDAVGKVKIDGEWEWLLVEAKGHLGEIKSDCQAKSKDSISQIERTLEEAKSALGAPSEADWLNGYYQYANRIAVLHHLDRHQVKARLLFIYFCGDRRPDSNVCPEDEDGWSAALAAQQSHLMLPGDHSLADRIHKLFLPVWTKNQRPELSLPLFR